MKKILTTITLLLGVGFMASAFGQMMGPNDKLNSKTKQHMSDFILFDTAIKSLEMERGEANLTPKEYLKLNNISGRMFNVHLRYEKVWNEYQEFLRLSRDSDTMRESEAFNKLLMRQQKALFNIMKRFEMLKQKFLNFAPDSFKMKFNLNAIRFDYELYHPSEGADDSDMNLLPGGSTGTDLVPWEG